MIDFIGLNGFCLNGRNSQDYGIIMTAPPPEVFAERDVETVNIPGRSGDLVQDNGRYKNITVTYQCVILPRNEETLRDAIIHAIALLKPSAAYSRLEDTYNPNYFRLARISSSLSVESIVEQAGTFQVKFDCKPQRFLKSGETAIAFDAPSMLYNLTAFPALPLITVYGTGPGTVTVGDTAVEIKAFEDQIILDCDLQNAYRQAGEGGPENQNGNIYAPQFPQLLPGENPVNWDGSITSVEIIPRWWTL